MSFNQTFDKFSENNVLPAPLYFSKESNVIEQKFNFEEIASERMR